MNVADWIETTHLIDKWLLKDGYEDIGEWMADSDYILNAETGEWHDGNVVWSDGNVRSVGEAAPAGLEMISSRLGSVVDPYEMAYYAAEAAEEDLWA